MIRFLDIQKPEETCIKWLGKVAALKAPRRFEFTPGLNILWGRNGSGKTTVLKLLARMFQCEQGGIPTVTQNSIHELFPGFRDDDDEKVFAAVEVSHDGQGVRHFDPSHSVGLIGGGAGFDDDFFTAGVMNTMFKGSAGQTTLYRFEQIMGGFLKDSAAPKPDFKMKKEHVNETWSGRIELIEKFLKGSGEKGPVTVMFDEPERSFDLPTQAQLWRLMRAQAHRAQFIIASHSIFALNIPEANYHEIDKGYLAASKAALDLLPKWAEEKPFPKRPDDEKPEPKKAKKKA